MARFSAHSVGRLKSRCYLGGSPIWRITREKYTSGFLLVGRIQFLAIVELRSAFPFWLPTWATLSLYRPHSFLVTWPPPSSSQWLWVRSSSFESLSFSPGAWPKKLSAFKSFVWSGWGHPHNLLGLDSTQRYHGSDVHSGSWGWDRCVHLGTLLEFCPNTFSPLAQSVHTQLPAQLKPNFLKTFPLPSILIIFIPSYFIF